MTEDTTDETPKLALSPVQVAASALAAVSAAVFASWFGTAGTLIGAALGSVVATVGAATYSYSLQRTAAIAREKAALVRDGGAALRRPRPARHDGQPDDTQALDRQSDDTQVLSPAEETAEEAADGVPVPWWKRLDPRGADLPWVKIGLASAAVMVVAMVALTSFEGLTGRSASSYLGNDESSSTTVGNVFGGDTTSTDDSEEPSQTPTSTPSSEPSSSPTDEPTEEPSESPSEEPTETEAPVPTPTPTLPTTPTPSVEPDAGAGTPGATPSS